MENHERLVKEKLDNAFKKIDADNLWLELSEILNASGGLNKTVAQWRKLVNNIQDMAEPATSPNVDPFPYGLVFEDEVETGLLMEETESVPLPKRKYSNEGSHSSGKRARISKLQQVEALVEVEEKKTLALDKIGDNLGKIADNFGKIASVLGRFLNK